LKNQSSLSVGYGTERCEVQGERDKTTPAYPGCSVVGRPEMLRARRRLAEEIQSAADGMLDLQSIAMRVPDIHIRVKNFLLDDIAIRP
jgi:hypothetical protein